MRKIGKILIVIIFVVIGIATSVTTFVFESNIMTEKISQEYYSDDAVPFFVTGSSKADIEYIINCMSKGEILYGEINKYSRGVYMKDCKVDVPLIWGRSFCETDFFTNKKVALIGRKLLVNCEIINGIYYYPIEGNLYEIIGILGMSSASLLDNYLWINLDSMLDIYHSDGFYVLDGSDNCSDILQEPILEGIVEKVEKEEVGIKAMYKNDTVNQNVCALLLLCILICAWTIIIFWLECQKYPVSVKKLCGISNKNIFGDLVREFAILCCSGYSFGNIATVLAIKSMYSSYNHTYSLKIMILFILFALVPVILYLKNWTNRFLR